MLLKDMLSDDILKNLNNIKNKKEKKTKNNYKKINNKDKSVANKTNVKKSSKNKSPKREDLSVKEYKEKKYSHFILECPYCASKDLELTGNNYYYCEECGIKVDKKYDY